MNRLLYDLNQTFGFQLYFDFFQKKKTFFFFFLFFERMFRVRYASNNSQHGYIRHRYGNNVYSQTSSTLHERNFGKYCYITS